MERFGISAVCVNWIRSVILCGEKLKLRINSNDDEWGPQRMVQSQFFSVRISRQFSGDGDSDSNFGASNLRLTPEWMRYKPRFWMSWLHDGLDSLCY
ncbi:hypothetical protein CEXT_611301 [Caerostris extrusa]|uniref:Uncharacterized protein n=1 Tax=Caerostris extrusa TaxID=172846 RepID=A0AAV4MGY9_CAEEX|nr:hypothetical protein CEXT_611301 [Caerostris extrusa]